jgi:uncharacterized protein
MRSSERRKHRPIHRSMLAGLAFVALCGTAIGQADPETPQIRVTGNAMVSVPPESADVDVGVVTEAAEAQQAARLNAEKVDAVRKALVAAVGPEVKLETTNYSLQPKYRRSPEPGNELTVSGYTATNVLRVKDLNLDSVGKVIDAATDAGANTVSNTSFGLRDEEEVKGRALRLAAANARSKVDALASALGVHAGRILRVIEGEPDVVRPVSMFRGEMAMAQGAPPTTPIEPNSIEVRASVTLIVEISP